jgi:hypothetical protein
MIVILSMLLAADTTAFDANAAGMKHSKAKQYREAITQFKLAIELGGKAAEPTTLKDVAQLNRTIALAHFNLACTLALARKAGKVCDYDAYRSASWEQVRLSIARDPNRLEKAMTDADLANVRDTLAFQSVKGLSPKRESDVSAIVAGVRWWSPGQGVYGSTQELSFSPQGSVTLTMLVFDSESVPLPKRQSFTGKWSVSGRGLRVTFPAAIPALKKASFDGTLGADGQLMFTDWSSFTDEPSECDA